MREGLGDKMPAPWLSPVGIPVSQVPPKEEDMVPSTHTHMANMPKHIWTHSTEQTEHPVPDAPWPGTGLQPQPGQQSNKTSPTPTPRQQITTPNPKWQDTQIQTPARVT
ncbi:hypothetical protein AMECASPLE_032120 [Ameca splendens]|uniref:Uncharacterized protein n=1 Tax=Ameca splendens TaxID=208324 RepID=A0ABV0XVZ2_9TELE